MHADEGGLPTEGTIWRWRGLQYTQYVDKQPVSSWRRSGYLLIFARNLSVKIERAALEINAQFQSFLARPSKVGTPFNVRHAKTNSLETDVLALL